jgi:NADPH:quinone reductase-like Zn-dependent oxidoreductase
MRAAVCTRYGSPDVIAIQELPDPVPRAGEVLIRVIATTVSSGDWRLRALAVPTGLRTMIRLAMGWNRLRQPILGSDLCGEVIALGTGVSRFRLGERVVAFAGVRMGCHAERRALPESAFIVPKPPSLSDHEAASLAFGGTTALHFLRDKGAIAAGQRVLVIGAAGCVGSAAVQLARHFGAEVTAVTSAANHELARSLGAERAIDYHTTDFAGEGRQYDLILDAVNATTFARARSALAPAGRLLMVAAEVPGMLRAATTILGGQKACAGMAPERLEDVQFLAELAERGEYRPVVDSVYPLEEIVTAHRRAESGRKRGSVVVEVG